MEEGERSRVKKKLKNGDRDKVDKRGRGVKGNNRKEEKVVGG